MLPRSLSTRLAAILGRPLGAVTPVSGGSINQSFRVDTATGPVFVKHHAHAPRAACEAAGGLGFFAAEADGLARLGAAVRVPVVIAVLGDALVLEWLAPTPRTAALEASAGRALAALHTRHGERFGLAVDNFMGAVPQDNRAATSATFATFFRERRLDPLAHYLPTALRHRLDALPLDRLLTEPTAPCLIHGDLWSGNLHYGLAAGTPTPVFIDPAVSYGHPEQDLALTRLFGGFSDAFYAAYREQSGLTFDRALALRLEVLKLYPLLIHVALFGGGYTHDVAAILEHFT